MAQWKNYEEVARYLLDCFATECGLDRFEGKQKVLGNRSTTEWEIDAKGVRQNDGGFFIVECRRYCSSRQTQEQLGGLAYRIIDAGAEGGIIVTPMGIQEGAKKVAAAENIIDVHLDENSTPDHFEMHFLNKFKVGASIPLYISGTASVEHRGADGLLK